MNDLTKSPISADIIGATAISFLDPSDAIFQLKALSKKHQLFSQSNLVSDDQPGHLNAQIQDSNLINPWGVAFGPKSPFWVNNNHTGTATIYSVDPTTDATRAASLVVTIAPPAGADITASPTGIVFNSDSNGFMLNGKPATFIMDTEDGTISAWNGGQTTTLEVDYSNNPAHGDGSLPPEDQTEGIGAVYKGLAIGTQNNGTTLLYASNFRHGTVDVFNDQFQQVNSLTDGNLPNGYAPFNVQVLDGNLFVTYALQDQFKHDDVAGAGNGFVDEFSLSGKFIARVASSDGPLNSPWGLAIAPSDFGKFAGDLLVGNFGDGTINAFDLKHHDKFVGQLTGVDSMPIKIGDLWTLTPGNGGSAGSTGEIYFTAGVQGESQGLFGSISPVPGTDHFMVSGSPSHGMG